MKKNILFYARDKKQLNRLYESHSDSGEVEICRAVSFILFGAFWTQKLNFMVKILEPFHFSLKFWSSNKSKVLSLITVFNFRLHSVIQTLFCMVSLNVKGINSTGHFWRCSTKKIVQLDSHCHHPSFCPLIPKLCSVKSQHWP